ncbi:hypothetical protein ST201phi2-1p108 [Pseudomonas phage 201phi2-1]|uniref:Uncharacterized protein n=1 Tax=Pseudomonas phage 201phi2-1 TaxID=198110 RepID=B3FIX1_BP201|nr:hypothetical protein ST201phi2-1p108 [Pseudomonas phage 201phi2-1]ABY62940.1 hypothetical protein 201phi2-1p108 [Pseudomonas phage 201phi2-1]
MGLVLKFDKTDEGLMLDGNPVTISLGGQGCRVEASSISLTYTLPKSQLPEGSKHEISYTFKADSEGVIQSVTTNRTELVRNATGNRWYTDRFPDETTVYLVYNASVLDYFKVTVGDTRMAIKDYLVIRPKEKHNNPLDHIGW